jgi:hypothetical protein
MASLEFALLFDRRQIISEPSCNVSMPNSVKAADSELHESSYGNSLLSGTVSPGCVRHRLSDDGQNPDLTGCPKPAYKC